jgi:hypothetical protein
LSFCIQFFRQCVSIAFQRALTFAIYKKIALANDACSKTLIIIRSHNLHVGDIRGVMGEIASYHEKNYNSLSPKYAI